MMEKIPLTNKGKSILKELQKNSYPPSVPDDDIEDIILLQEERLITAHRTNQGHFCVVRLTDKGRAYLHANPKLKDPSIWDDKKYWITTAISVIAIILSIIALCK